MNSDIAIPPQRKDHAGSASNLQQSPKGSWRKLLGSADLGKVITGINFKDGIEQPESENKAA
ncbi:hypothetical protein GCM10007094_00350 [Pseudovibrio japonicus]|uniref:Uncharacterized protein n=1 Tax=Pseudovibrio japonicus TaxID=366534 RepID=A0ABQ3DUK3_9HYPH|nr:hypothetical protein [Pseudovibrio japonicus]GHB16909.1 hypothetical protein GCM10007094_00350 [Pseudovibrio japonicus]